MNFTWFLKHHSSLHRWPAYKISVKPGVLTPHAHIGVISSILCHEILHFMQKWEKATSKRESIWQVGSRKQRVHTHSLICKFKERELTLNLDIEALLLSPFSLINRSSSLSGSGVSPEHGGPTPCNLSAAASSSPASCSLTTVILVGLWLALGALGLGVGCARRVWLLNWHGPPQVGALAKEVGLCWETEGTFPQDHADGGRLLGSGSVSKLKRGEVRCIAIAQKLNVWWRESQRAARFRTLTAKVRRYQVKNQTQMKTKLPGTGSGTSSMACQQCKSVRGWGPACCKQRCPSWSHKLRWSWYGTAQSGKGHESEGQKLPGQH